jgi:DNA modification methylase
MLTMARPAYRVGKPRRYGFAPEIGYVLTKGKPETVQLIYDRRNKYAGVMGEFHARRKDGTERKSPAKPIAAWGRRGLVWTYATGSNQTTRDKIAFAHPALMPERMAEDFIISYSLPGDCVFDPMAGGGTVPKMALLNGRKYLGMEIHEPYYHLAVERMQIGKEELRRRLDGFFGTSSG